MKKILLILFTSLIYGNIQAQVIVNGTETYPLTGTGSAGTSFDLGTNIFSYDSAPSLVGGFKYIARKGDYWFIFSQGLGMIYSGTIFLTARTVNPYPGTINPPDCAQWQTYVVTPPSPGYEWVGYSSTFPDIPNGTIVQYNLTGMVTSAGPGTSTQILAPYIDLSTKSSTDIATYSNFGGRLLYNLCENAISFNNGSAWKNVWPNNLDYAINHDQKLVFGPNNSQIFGKSVFVGGTNQTQLILKTNNVDRIVLENDGSQNSSKINLKSSVSVPISQITSNYTVADNDYTLILNP
ncbi:MAG: hypothetical protein ACRCVT_15630, partial [Leadbetterella sp.]